jgi:hypothetical protein
VPSRDTTCDIIPPILNSHGPEPVHRLRIFLSSPSDVAEERQLTREAVAELARQPGFESAKLEVVGWDDPQGRTPLVAQLDISPYARPMDLKELLKNDVRRVLSPRLVMKSGESVRPTGGTRKRRSRGSARPLQRATPTRGWCSTFMNLTKLVRHRANVAIPHKIKVLKANDHPLLREGNAMNSEP